MTQIENKFYLVGHRGAAGERLENSPDGFRHALTLPIDAIELDIREHQSQLWVFHDREVDRLTDRTGDWFQQDDIATIRLDNGEAIPTLREVLDLYWARMPINVEIKSISNFDLLLNLLAEYPDPGAASGLPWIFISSFKHEYLLDLHARNCPWPLAPLSYELPEDTAELIDAIKPRTWHFSDKHIDLNLVRDLREQGIQSLVYTVNSIERARYLRSHGLAGIFTDEPSLMLSLD